MYRHIYRNSITIPSKYASYNARKISLFKNNNLVSQTNKPPNLVKNDFILPLSSSIREINIGSPGPYRKDAESKVEKTSHLLKDKMIGPEGTKQTEGDIQTEKTIVNKNQKEIAIPRPTLGDRIIKEVKHYYNGFKLLFLETRICLRLLNMVLNGHTLTRRERKQFTRTSADLFRLVPFSLFIIIPFMELALPIFIKIFPNMLPSTFAEESKEKENMKKRLVAKLEMAKFLQDTLEETAMKGSKKNQTDNLGQKFSEFMTRVREGSDLPTNEEITKFSSLFENELTLDNLTRQQLIALCQILEVSTLGNIPPNHILRFQLRMKIRSLEADDKMIIKEGIDKLDERELQQACRDRGMRAMGLSIDRLKYQLQQWLDLHIKQNIPISLLIFSRSLYLPENLPTEDIIKSTLSALPKSIENATAIKLAEMSGSKVDNTARLSLIKEEDDQIKLENIEHDVEELKDVEVKQPVSEPKTVPSAKPEVIKPIKTIEFDMSKALKGEELIDRVQVYMRNNLDKSDLLTPKEIKEMSQIIDNLPSNQKHIISDEINELKKDFEEYNEDVKEVEEMSATESQSGLTETKSAKILSQRVQKLIGDMDVLINNLEDKKPDKLEKKNMVSIEELMSGISQIKGNTNGTENTKLLDVLKSLDTDYDGKIDDLTDVIKVFDIIEQENVKVTKSQLAKLITLLQREKTIEFEEELQELQKKQLAKSSEKQ